jgi:hypothetical protein
MGGAVAVILIKERHVVDAFVRAGAISPERAVFPSDVAVDIEGVGGRRLVKRAVLREAAAGRYYLDAPSWEALRGQRRRLAFALVLAIALGAFILATTGVFFRPI